MERISSQNRAKFSAKDLVLPAVFTALIAVCAWISIPLGPVPFTLQTLAVLLCGGLLGVRRSMYAMLVYTALGAIGVPVFSGFSSGLASPSSGFVIGFIFTALVTALITQRFGHSMPVLLIAMVLGDLACYVFGIPWFMVLYCNTVGPISFGSTVAACVIPFIIPDLIKIVLAAVLTNRLYKYTQKLF